MQLCRYQPINKQTISNLSIQRNWIADPLKFNDPFEFHLKDEYFVDNNGTMRIRDMDQLDNRAKIKSLISELGVICYCPFDDNILLWSHYGDSHKGMCLVFDVPNPIEDLGFEKVEYDKEQADTNFKLMFENVRFEIVKIIRTKSEGWNYEHEYRQVFNKKNQYAIYPGRLVEIVFGCQSTKSDIELVIKLVQSQFPEIRISKLYISRYSFLLGKMSFQLFKDKKYFIPEIWDGKCIK